jgi:adenosine deaminase
MAPYEFVRNYDKNIYPGIADALNRYVKLRLSIEEIEKPRPDILLVEVHSNRFSWNSDKFQEEIKKLKDETINGILFYTLEEYPRGDEPDSLYNKSRLLREFFENSFNAVTASHKDIFSKLSSLIQQIFKNKNKGRKLAKVIKNLERLEKSIPKSIGDLENGYPYGGIHTKDGHKVFRTFIDNYDIKSYEEIKKLEEFYDHASIFSNNPSRHKPFQVLVIDDNYKDVANDFKKIKDFFPDKTEIYITHSGEWKTILEDKESEFWEKMYRREATLKIKKIEEIHNDCDFPEESLFNGEGERGKFSFNFVIVDLLLEHYNEGNKIINNLERFRANFNRLNPDHRTYFDIIVLSLTEEVPDIHRSLNEGSLYFVPKKRINMLPAVIAQLETTRRILEERGETLRPIKKSHNLEKLYLLPEIVKRRIQNEPFLDLPDIHDMLKRIKIGDEEKKKGEKKKIIHNLEEFFKIPAARWIKKMPKADIHCHFGGSMRGDAAFFLSLNMLVLPNEMKEEYRKEATRIINDIIKKFHTLIKAVLKINKSKGYEVYDLFYIFKIAFMITTEFDIKAFVKLKEKKSKLYIEELEKLKEKITEFLEDKKKSDSRNLEQIYSDIISTLKKNPEKIGKWLNSIKEKSGDFFDERNVRVLKPDKRLIAEKKFFEILQSIIRKEALKLQCKAMEEKGHQKKELETIVEKILVPHQAVNIFNVLIGILEGKTHEDVGRFWSRIETALAIRKEGIENAVDKIKINMILGLDIKTVKEENGNLLKSLKEFPIKKLPVIGPQILNHFISAKKRDTNSLAEYLGGCEFTGAEQLKKKENIIAAAYDIIDRNIADNVRLLELKFSPDGYVNEDLTLQEAVQTALLGTDLITLYFYNRGKFIRVNYIFTVKRHKTPEEAALEISAALTNREREKFYMDIKPAITKKNVEISNYEWKPSRVVGVDLAGLEKENPARNFVNDFYPLFKTSSLITIHAGEEDTARSIWEAVYLLHANRIGHGLPLKESLELKNFFKNLQICIEMNPISNLLTNPGIEKRYPFYDFVLEGLKITVNTDNPAVSDSTLSEEFVKAAELFQIHQENTKRDWMSKWEILRVLKNAFSSSFLDREDKRNLMRAVEEEIYQKIIEEYGL